MALLDQLGIPETVLDTIEEGVFTVDLDFRICSFNRAAEELLGLSRAEVLGQPCSRVFHASACVGRCPLRISMEEGGPVQGCRLEVRDRTGSLIPISVSTQALCDAQGRIIGGVESFRDLRQEEALRRAAGLAGSGAKELAQASSENMGQDRPIIARSPAMRELLAQLPIIAATAVTVLISGESGTGKELFAQALHQHSPRRNKPFVALNCAAIPDSLLESELFGYRAGAFTDARQDKPGRFALADQGTLFLDEIGDVSPAMQVRLLRVLQERCYEPLGGSESVPCDVRVIAASNLHLPAEVQAGRFRQDLYYRLAVIPLHLPPLRERGEDVLEITRAFVARLAAVDGVPPPDLGPGVIARLLAHSWPGNVRELTNAIERAWVLGHGQIQVEHLPGSGLTGSFRRSRPTQAVIRSPADQPALLQQERSPEAEALFQALRSHAWNRLATARTLGIHKTTLYRQIRRFGLRPPRAQDATQ